ncbi:hypothetical protein ACIQGZ_00645 [Streptomyces sp. NPDC092296]|uniref:hypothetical protein n=1 Tax=Streptomyces sp. NPDC092296 TaxID=3366012 RepID=UPI00380F301B
MTTADGPEQPVQPFGDLSAEARHMYVQTLRAGGRLAWAGGRKPASEEDRALRELLNVGLLVGDPDDPAALVAVDPRQLVANLTAAWQRGALELLSQSLALPTALRELSEAYDAIGNQPKTGGDIEYVEGKVEINQRLTALIDQCSEEVLTAQPGGGRGGPIEMKVAAEQDAVVLRRGVSRRTIYQPSARYSAPTRQYVEAMTREGGQVRTLAEPFTRLFVFDRRIAIIPIVGDVRRAAFVADDVVVGYLVSVFEGLWERAIPFLGDVEVPPQVISHLREKIVQMMIQGVGHRVIARSLGLSERTLARHIAEMREEHGVDTLFQLGWKMGQAESYRFADGEDVP